MSDRLTLKQDAFISTYLTNGGNATDAYRQAYDCSNMTDKSINENASKLLKNAKVAPRLQALQERAAAKVVLTRSFVLEGLMNNAKAAALAEDYTASNKAFELLGKTDEVPLFVERSIVQSDNRHHHTAESLSDFHEHLGEVLGAVAETAPKKPVSN